MKGHVGLPCHSVSSFALYIDYWSYDHILSSNYVSYLRIGYYCIVLSFDALIELYLWYEDLHEFDSMTG